MIIEINEEQLYKHWNKDTIEKISSEKNMSFLETVIYLWLYNNVSISAKDRDIDFGRKMYEKFAKGIVKFLTDRTKEQKIERLKKEIKRLKREKKHIIADLEMFDNIINKKEQQLKELENGNE